MIEEWLQARLENFAPIADAAGVAVPVFPVCVEEGQAEPFITFKLAGRKRDYNTRKNDGKPTATFQIFCWDSDYGRLKRYANQVRIAIDGYRADTDGFNIRRAFVIDESDIEDPSEWGFELPAYGVQFDLELCHTETVPDYTS